AVQITQLFCLPSRPQRSVCGWRWLREGGLGMTAIAVVPVSLGQPVVRIYSQDIGDVGSKPVVEIEPRIVRVFFDQHRIAVTRLGKAIQHVLFSSFSARFENQSDARAVE